MGQTFLSAINLGEISFELCGPIKGLFLRHRNRVTLVITQLAPNRVRLAAASAAFSLTIPDQANHKMSTFKNATTSTVSRRNFLQTSAIAGAGALAALHAPHVHAAGSDDFIVKIGLI